MKKIVRASFGKRLLAIAIDVLASSLLALLIYQAAVHPIWYQYLGGQAINQTLTDIQLNSHLFVLDDNERLTDVSSSQYETAITYFYLESELFSFENTSLYHATDHPEFNFYEDILYRGVADSDTEKGTLFVFSDVIDPLTQEVTTVYEVRADVSSAELNLFWQNTYKLAKEHLTYSPSYFDTRLAIANFIFYGLGGAFVFSSAIFILGFSFLFGDGRSIGKYIMGLGLVRRDGFKVKSGAILVRFLAFSIVEILLSFRLFFIPLFLSSAIMTLDRNQASLHDRLARTVVIDWQRSFIFVSREEETMYHQARTSTQPTQVKVSGGMALKGLAYIPEAKKPEEDMK